MIVEDNLLNLKLFRDLLTIKKHETILSTDGVGVVSQVEKELPDLILMDIQLNGISGIDLIKELKHNPKTKDIAIIAISAFAMKQDEQIITASGCDMYISKPVAINDFFKAIDQFVKQP